MDLISLSRRINGPWLVPGDFNATLGAHEQHSGGLPGILSCADFQNFIEDCNLFHMPTSGLKFSWARNRGSLGYIERKLDRTLCNSSSLNAWSTTHCHVLPRSISDHSLMVIASYASDEQKPKPFRFQTMWLHHHDFRKVVNEVWNSI